MGRRDDLFWTMKHNLSDRSANGRRGYQRAEDRWKIYHFYRSIIRAGVLCAIPVIGTLIFTAIFYPHLLGL